MIIIMGVSGCGKTTVGKLLSEKLKCPFYDADDFHPKENIEKMSKGTALTDSDRWPWLDILSEKIAEWSKKGEAVLACSALKESYREQLESNKDITWVYLEGEMNTIITRLNARNNHFMKATMLQSQFETLEPPSYGIRCKIDSAPSKIASEIISKLNFHA